MLQQETGYAGSHIAQEAQETQANQIRYTISDILDRANRCESILRTSVDRLVGSTPRQESNGVVETGKVDGFIPELTVRLNQLTHALQEIEEIAHRLQQAV